MGKHIEIDTRTFIRFWLVLLGIGLVILFIYKALTGLIILGISIFLALALRPLVRRVNDFLEKHFNANKSHKTASVILSYSLIVLFFAMFILIVGPVVVNETSKFIQQLPETFQNSLGGWEGVNDFGRTIGIENLQSELAKTLQTFSESILTNLGSTVVTSISTIGDVIMKGVLILILTLLFLLEGPEIAESFWRSLKARKEDEKPVTVANHVFYRMCDVVSTYVSRQIMIGLLDGAAVIVITFILSFIFQFSTSLAIPMGLMAFVFFLIPMFGQIITGCLVALVLAFSSPIAAIVFAAIYIVYAQIENNVISPKIQGDALQLPAVAILAAMVIGMYMFGLLGAIIAIPIAGCIRVFIEEYPNIKTAKD